jgi:DNA-binding transcriptional ArsR family regulator
MIIMDKLIIDKETLKAISVDSRLRLLKTLHIRKYTLSELANILKLSPSTLKEHLDILCAAKLIKKEDTNRKWKYYSLTFKGLNIVNPNETKALFSFILSLVITIGLLAVFLNSVLMVEIGSASTFDSESILQNTSYSVSNEDLVEKSNLYDVEMVRTMDVEFLEKGNFDVNWPVILNVSIIIFSLFTIYLFVYFIKQKNNTHINN